MVHTRLVLPSVLYHTAIYLGTCHLCCCQRKVHSCRGDQCPFHGCPTGARIKTDANRSDDDLFPGLLLDTRISWSSLWKSPAPPIFSAFFSRPPCTCTTDRPSPDPTNLQLDQHPRRHRKEGGLKESTKRRRCNVVPSRDGRGIPWNTQHALKKPLLSDPPAVGTARIPHQQRHPSQPSNHPLCRHCWPAPHARA